MSAFANAQNQVAEEEEGASGVSGTKRKTFWERTISDPVTSKILKDDDDDEKGSTQPYEAFVHPEMHNRRYRSWTQADIAPFLAQFEAAYSRPITAVIDGAVADNELVSIETTINTKNIVNPTMTFMYFIGRLNPPHDGHISALVALIEAAKEKGAIPLILLGSGPNGGARTMDNPITFQNKYDFITAKLASEKSFRADIDYKIKEMTNPVKDVAEFVIEGLDQASVKPENVDISQFAGEKGDDTTKLKVVATAASKTASKKIPSAVVTGGVVAIPAKASSAAGGDPMSATRVRTDAYQTLITNSVYKKANWLEDYGEFYGENAEPIYDAIIEVVANPETLKLIPGITQKMIADYINEGKLPPQQRTLPTSKYKPEKGGSRKSKTKKRSNLKKRRTQRKKRRTTRRK